MLNNVIVSKKHQFIQNKIALPNVMTYVMRTTDKNSNIVDDKQVFKNRFYYSEIRSEGTRLNDNQQFIVPWQLQKTDERKKLENVV